MAEFSADRAPSTEALHGGGRPRSASVGAQGIPAKVTRPRGARLGGGLGRATPQHEQSPAEQSEIGRPGPDPQQEQDLSYLDLASQHFNMKGQGRDIPYVVWATLTGNYRQYAQPGHPPFDYLED